MKIISKYIEAHIIRRTQNGIEFLLLKRSPDEYYPNIWQMVTGKYKDDEKAYETARREIQEETGITVNSIFAVPSVNSFYSPTDDAISILPVFAAVIDNYEEVTISNEHSEFKWVKAEIAKELLIWPGQKRSVDIIEEYFVDQNSILNFIEIKF